MGKKQRMKRKQQPQSGDHYQFESAQSATKSAAICVPRLAPIRLGTAERWDGGTRFRMA
jgi:hypothetical protein